ncbi:transcriptional coactivator p15/PC4 family protein [Leptospira sp. GIMC2001]|uniref:transcriptional coactivator p15/PC4 family protein n=1 Tax=Leptospira sp. GIMC2001 TaxID=1513297 RepID=UPI00234A3367|nr:transcriptional coactivator p15/PC4 family protein [Leptospira sp. GIMC2001]WCL49562.1 transcriptional coactivator p15/PC4 family protein [Leptospira sp. GIMC2001]
MKRTGVVRDIDKGARGEVIRVEVSEFKGSTYLNLRVWYTDKDGELKPTQKGIAIPPELYDQVKEAITEAESWIKD